MPSHRRDLLRDRRGVSGIAVGALLAIAVLLFYLQFISTLQGAEVAFWAIFGFLKWLATILGYPHLFDEFEKLIKDLQGTPFWPMLVYMLSLAFMSSILYGTLYDTKGIVDITTRILAWRRARREEKRKMHEKNEKEYRLWKKNLEDDEEPLTILPKLKVASKHKPKALVLNKSISTLKKEPEDYKTLLTTEWSQIRETHVITLTKGKLREVIEEAKKLFPTARSPQGSYHELARAIGMDYSNLRETVKQGKDSMTVENLMKLLDVLKEPYDILTPYIRSVGGRSEKEAIVNPKFPINMENPDGGRLLAATLKDGHINKRNQLFYYTNYDPENLRMVTEAVQRVFGDIEPTPVYEDGKQKGICFTSTVISDVLIRAGAIAGSKVEQDYGLPDLIKFGDSTIGNAYFEHAIRDDGHKGYRWHQLSLRGAHELESKVMPEHRILLKYLHWKPRLLPSGAIEFFVNFREGLEDDLPHELRPVYEDFLSKMRREWVPTILEEERQVIEKIYGVVADIYPKEIYKGKSGLRGYWEIMVQRKEDFEKMIRQIGSVWKEGGDRER